MLIALSNVFFVSDVSSVMISFAAANVVDGEDDLLANIETPSVDVPPNTAAPKMNLLNAILAVVDVVVDEAMRDVWGFFYGPAAPPLVS